MNCCNHQEIEAVATCCDCGQGLCEECAGLYKIVICSNCNLKRGENAKREIFHFFLPSIILFAIGTIGTFITGWYARFWEPFVIGYALAALPWGWRFMSRFSHLVSAAPNFFIRLIMNVFVFFPLRVLIAVFAGAIVMPIGFIKPIIRLISTNIKQKNIMKNLNN